MRSFRKLSTAGVIFATLGAGPFCLRYQAMGGEPVKGEKFADASESEKPKDAEPSKPAAGADPKAAASPADGGKSEKMHDIPVAKDHPAKGLKIPYFDGDGKLQMMFVIGVATRIDADHIDLADSQVETFDAEGKHEMFIELPTSVLDLNTNVISTQKHVTIRREDFVLTGEAMEFNTKTKQGNLGGGVKMLVYNLDDQAPPAGSPNTTGAKKEKKEKGPTEITSGEATFDQKAHIAIFSTSVVVKDPEFNVVCDKLTTYLKHDEPAKAGGKGSKVTLKRGTPPPVKPKPGDPEPAKKSGGLERAVAEMNPGRRVEITQDKKEADGTITHSIGHGIKADYDAKTGDIKLFGKPDVKKGTDSVIATDDSTAITLNRDGHMTTDGPSETVIVNKDEAGKEKSQTHVTSGQSMLNQKEHIAIFSSDVVVNDPEFNVVCDKLTAYLKHDEPAKTGGKIAKATPAPATPSAEKGKAGGPAPVEKTGGLERAVAEMNPGGRVKITQDKVESDGTVSHATGNGTKADYNAITGDIQLFGKPEVKKGDDWVLATDESTEITMNRDGHMATDGPSKTIISNKDETQKKAKGPTEITSGKSTLDQKAHIAIFSTDVVVEDPEFNVVCDKLTAYLKHDEADKTGGKGAKPTPKLVTLHPGESRVGDEPPKKTSSGLERAIAEMEPGGRVEITQDKKEADGTVTHAVGHGTKADYHVASGDIKLFGKPEIKKGTDWLIATEERTVITLNRDGKTHADGPSKTVIIDKGEAEKK